MNVEQMVSPKKITKLKFDEKGLITAIVQDAKDGAVLMTAYMNEEALKKTIETGYTHFYSRSRKELWNKGATSGHTQKVKEIRVDCDADCLLVIVEQSGPGACHTGHRSCFHRDISGKEIQPKAFDEKKVYGK